MRIRRSVLARFTEVPRESRLLRDLFDDVGLEVKRLDDLPGDVGLTLELLANRGDHHGYEGIARELSGRTGHPVQAPPVAELTVGASPIPMTCTTEKCPVYTATLLVRDEPGLGQLTPEQLAPITAADQDSVSAPVDATNLANLELGQPTHAFDADTLVGGIQIRLSTAGETALPLFADERIEVPEGTLVIADSEKILAIAGVIGCQESRTTESTRRIVLESAHFDPVSVRLASRAIQINTDSSARFERGSDPSAPLRGAGRVVELLKSAGWRVEGNTGVVGDWTDPHRVIPLSVPAAGAFLEVPLRLEDTRDRLTRYGFIVSPAWPEWDADQGWSLPAELDDASPSRLRNIVLVRVPAHRLWDVEDVADLYEELAKSIGYNETPSHLPPIDLGALPSVAEQQKDAASQVLLGLGFTEVVLDGFYGRDLIERLDLPETHPLHRAVETQNALDRAYSLLKNNGFVQAIECVGVNLNLRTDQIKAFEWTRTFHPDLTAPNGVCTERDLLWAVACGQDREAGWAEKGRPADAWFLKGVVQSLATELKLPLTVGPASADDPLHDVLHPGRQAGIYLGSDRIGVLGEAHPKVLAAYKIKRARPVYLEIDAGALLAAAPKGPDWSMPSSSQSIERDLAFTLPDRVHAGDEIGR
ncbi:MAG: phenylalanine--tRNA ligase beta subunit-related protein, partial [Myxococcota bacterium]